jgi:hypothetical protein
MVLTKKLGPFILVISVLLFGGWLFHHDEAAQPGPLSLSHGDLQDCSYCHEPWKGASVQQCLECHDFLDTTSLRKEIRFHEVRQKCMSCHQEHGLIDGGISRMEHKLLNEELLCTQCHFDPHRGLFGQKCRECHRIRTWNVARYRHPAPNRTDCYLCHKGPESHSDARFWKMIVKRMGKESADQKACWRCHTISDWSHLQEGIPGG